jgi:hypothetical protein
MTDWTGSSLFLCTDGVYHVVNSFPFEFDCPPLTPCRLFAAACITICILPQRAREPACTRRMQLITYLRATRVVLYYTTLVVTLLVAFPPKQGPLAPRHALTGACNGLPDRWSNRSTEQQIMTLQPYLMRFGSPHSPTKRPLHGLHMCVASIIAIATEQP